MDIGLLFLKCFSQEKSADQYLNFIKTVFDTAATELFSVICSIIGEISSNMLIVWQTKYLNVVHGTISPPRDSVFKYSSFSTLLSFELILLLQTWHF